MNMETTLTQKLKLDRTKLKTVKNFAVQEGVTPQQVYNWIKSNRVKAEIIDGVTFIYTG